MFRIRCLIVVMALSIPLFTGCTEKVDNVYEQRLDNVEKAQKEMLAKMTSLEASQKEIMKLAKQGRRN
ncbi:MAG TPA: hypothetical protein ENH18_01260, partial [Nitrospirae bacterium]|nr:hypothetical protein [Nitrospirota bacterium]HEW80976.1 hypothetical protein [Nitrospirota bacterium]